jgi:IS5 family transposase
LFIRSTSEKLQLQQLKLIRENRMNMHKNARLTPKGREVLIRRLERGERPGDVACAMGVSIRTVYKWRKRYREEGLDTTTAKVHDSQIWDDLLHGGETSVWADKAYVSAERAEAFAGPGKFWGVMRKAPKGGELHPDDDYIKSLIAKVRARVEHPFRVLKRQFGYIKTRYRGLGKNRAQLFSLFALGNLYLVRKRLMA